MATHKVFWCSPPGPTSTSREEDFDDQFGKCCPPWNKPIREPFELALGNGKMNQEAFDELMQPIYGENQNQTFADLLPYVQKVPLRNLIYSNYKLYPDVLPNPEENVLYNVRKMESPGRYRNYPACTYDPYWWNIMQITDWKKVTEPATYTVPNPEYDIYLQKRADFKNLVSITFIPHGSYQFPGLPLKEGYKWFYDGVEIDQDPNHLLANADGGWKYFMKPLPISMWNGRYEAAVTVGLMLPAPYNLRAILSI